MMEVRGISLCILLVPTLFSNVCCNNFNVSIDVGDVSVIPLDALESRSLPIVATQNEKEGKCGILNCL